MEANPIKGAILKKRNVGKQPPTVKHTLTSLLRMVKANPLLQFEPEKQNSQISTIKDSQKIQTISNILKRSESVKEKPSCSIRKTYPINKIRQPKKICKVAVSSAQINDNENVEPSVFNKPDEKKTPTPSFSALNQQTTKSKSDESNVITFKTPNAYKRRSIAFFTPSTERKVSYTPYASTPAPDPADLKRKLDKWLKSRGKSLQSFHHLKCFGIKHDQATHNEENKENIEVKQDLSKGSYEDLKIVVDADAVTHSVNDDEKVDLEVIARGALTDLRKLILEEYPKEQCEAWLGSIRRKYKKLEEEPDYWECLAALEGAKGNIGAAVDCYRTAIIQGAEVKSVDTSLEQLLEKFSLLNITAEQEQVAKNKTDRSRVVLDARNAFKSTIIQFAMQERKLKKLNLEADKKVVYITPVRRSTRKSRSYLNTPDSNLYSSIQEARESVGEISFRGNRLLAARFNNE